MYNEKLIDERLEAYLSGTENSKDNERKIRKAVNDFKPLLKARGKTWPEERDEENDYEAYRSQMQSEKKAKGTIDDTISRARKVFEYAVDPIGGSCKNTPNSALHDVSDVEAPSQVDAPAVKEDEDDASGSKKTDPRRFSLLIHLEMYEALEWLSKYDKCSVARVILDACTGYVAARQGDIDYIRDMMSKLSQEIERRKAGNS